MTANFEKKKSKGKENKGEYSFLHRWTLWSAPKKSIIPTERFLVSIYTKMILWPELFPDPAVGAYSASPNLLTGFG